MYDMRQRKWIFCGDKEKIKAYCLQVIQSEDADILFETADYLLSQARRQDRNIDGVYYMEKAAKAGHDAAMFAMGQMAENGWAVGKSRKNAVDWYKKAVKAGNKDAEKALRRIRRKGRTKVIVSILVFMMMIGICIAAFYAYQIKQRQESIGKDEESRSRVLVGENTKLKETDTLQQFHESVKELAKEYDDELVIAGKRSTNRLIMHFEGKELNLTDFLADRVIARENNIVVIQFDSEEEARKCLESLKEMDQVSFVEMDEYSISGNIESGSTGVIRQASDTSRYYTWGCEDMGMDQLADWLSVHAVKQSVVVAVIDTGVKPLEDTSNRILSGMDVVIGGDGREDLVGHGTHVSGTILDCTQGLDVKVLPIGVFGRNSSTNTMSICTGLEYAISQSPDVINMSLGGPAQKGDSWQQTLVHQAVSQGITVVVSAGNGDDTGKPVNTNSYVPAAFEECLVVGAVDRDHNIASFSNYGDSVDVCAPGVDIVSYSIKPEGVESMDGTSMAAPHISALAAMLAMYVPDATPAQIEKYIKDYCHRLGDKLYYGEGIPQGIFYIEHKSAAKYRNK